MICRKKRTQQKTTRINLTLHMLSAVVVDTERAVVSNGRALGRKALVVKALVVTNWIATVHALITKL